MLHLLNLPPLHARRRYLKLVTMFNIINGHLYFPQGIFISQQPTYNSRRTSQFDFCRPRTQTDYYQTSYVPSVISAWNNLPVVVKSPCTVSSFNVNYETPRDLPSRGVKDAQFVSCVSCDIRCQLSKITYCITSTHANCHCHH